MVQARDAVEQRELGCFSEFNFSPHIRLKRAHLRLRQCIRTATFVAQEATTTN